MNWFKDNPVTATLLAIALIGTGATAYLASSAATRLADAESTLSTQQRTLTTLQKNKPFPSKDNVDALNQLVTAYSNEVATLLQDLAKKEPPLAPITPQAFQDNLRDAVDSIRTDATTKGITLPDQFFYGFDDYQTRLPADAEAPLLNREFSIIRTIADNLVTSGIASIDTLQRTPRTPLPADATPPPYHIDTFTLTFTAAAPKVRNAINSIASANEFLIIRSLSLRNTNPEPPPKSQPTPQPSASSFDNLPLPGDTPTLQIVLGTELVQATLQIEILDFPQPDTTTADTTTTAASD